MVDNDPNLVGVLGIPIDRVYRDTVTIILPTSCLSTNVLSTYNLVIDKITHAAIFFKKFRIEYSTT